MEWLIGIIIVILTGGNIYQYDQNKTLQEEKEFADYAAALNMKAYRVAQKENEELVKIIDSLTYDLNNCNSDIKSQLEKINSWKESDRLKNAAINDLKDRIDSIDFGSQCRVPDWVDFQAK
jgi:predicted nuclease with TOPRIM domain